MSAFDGTCCAALAAIAKFCEEHSLGLASYIYIIEACDITSIPAADADTHTVSTDITIDSGKNFFRWKVGGSAEFNGNSTGSKGNQTFQNVLTVFVPMSRDEVSYLANAIINGEFVVVFVDKNGNKRILGTEHSPAMIAEGGIQEAITEDANGHTFTFENMGKTPLHYTGAVSLTPAA